MYWMFMIVEKISALILAYFFFQAEDGIRDGHVTGVQTCALPICKCSFLPEEREWLQEVLDWGFTDTFRALTPETEAIYSWFDYRSRGCEGDPRRGLRIDLVLPTDPLQHP